MCCNIVTIKFIFVFSIIYCCCLSIYRHELLTFLFSSFCNGVLCILILLRHILLQSISLFLVLNRPSVSPIHDLSTNITTYNYMLTSLSTSNNLSILQLPISPDHLYADGIHVRHRFNPLLSGILYQHIHRLVALLTKPHSNQLPTPLTSVIETTPVISPQSTFTFTSSINPSSPN